MASMAHRMRSPDELRFERVRPGYYYVSTMRRGIVGAVERLHGGSWAAFGPDARPGAQPLEITSTRRAAGVALMRRA